MVRGQTPSLNEVLRPITNHPVSKFICRKCGFMFKDRSEMYHHQIRQHGSGETFQSVPWKEMK